MAKNPSDATVADYLAQLGYHARTLRHHSKAFLWYLFVMLTPWWRGFREKRRAKRRLLAGMGVSDHEFRAAKKSKQGEAIDAIRF